jgi:hypothetical protein
MKPAAIRRRVRRATPKPEQPAAPASAARWDWRAGELVLGPPRTRPAPLVAQEFASEP